MRLIVAFLVCWGVQAQVVPPEWEKWYGEARLLLDTTDETVKLPILSSGLFGQVVESTDVYLVAFFNGAAPSKPPMGGEKARNRDSNPVNSPPMPGMVVGVGSTGQSRVLRLYWSESRQDHTTCALDDISVCPSDGADYSLVREQGRCASPSEAMKLDATNSSTTLSFYWSSSALDNILAGANFSAPAGYTRVRVSCIASSTPTPAFSIPLLLWYSPSRKDHLATTTADGSAYAKANGYTFLGLQGFVGAMENASSARALDLLHATWMERRIVQSVENESVLISTRSYASQARPQLFVREINATCLSSSQSTATIPLSVSIGSGPGAAAPLTHSIVNASTYPITRQLFNGSAATAETPELQPTRVAAAHDVPPEAINVDCSNPTTLLLLSAYSLSLYDDGDVASAVLEAMEKGREVGSVGLFEEHARLWEEKWEGGRIEVGFEDESGLALAQSINSSIYLIETSARLDHPYEVPPGSAATDAYNSNRFWDGVSWMGMGVSGIDAALHVNFLEYRLNTLPGALWKAKLTGYEGGSYAWQSGLSGRELMDGQEGHYELHITSDVALSVRFDWLLRRNTTRLRQFFPILNATANFWLSRASPLPGSDNNITILNVQGPDEYHAGVNSSTYTNVAAAATMRFAAEAAKILDIATGKEEEWVDAAEKMLVLYDESSGIHPEFQGWTDGDVAKQADTTLVYSFFFETLAHGTIGADVNYYVDHTTLGGPAMTFAEFSVGAFLAGNETGGVDLFEVGYNAHVIPPFRVWCEVKGGGGAQHFSTGAGGFVGSVVKGFGGVHPRPEADGVEWSPPSSLPPNTTSLAIHSLDIFNTHLRIERDTSVMSAAVLPGAPDDVSFVTDSTCHSLPFTISIQKGQFLPKKC